LSLYVDTSALLKRYVADADSDVFREYLLADRSWVTGRHTQVEVRRNLSRLLSGAGLGRAKKTFESDWSRMNVIELDATVCDMAGDIAEVTQARTLDALHLATAHRVGAGSLPLLTADLRQAQVARSMGWTVLGA
jgi:predicted nucleic acid-binding protein